MTPIPYRPEISAMRISLRPLAAAGTSVLVAGTVLVAGSATAGAPQVRAGAPLLARSAVDAPGQQASTLNGHGLYKVRLANTADGRIHVSWKWKKSRSSRLKKWKIVTSTSRKMDTDVKVYHVKAKKRSTVVSHSASVTPASGDYTFVKVWSKPKHGKAHGSTTHWIQAPVTATPSGVGSAVIGTFNVRSAVVNDSGAQAWPNRRQKVIDTIKASGAGIVNLQEASGNDSHGSLTQLQDITNGTGMVAASTAHFAGASGSQGTRIIYDPNRYTLVRGSEGNMRLNVGDRYIEWAEFTDNQNPNVTFWDISMHLVSGTAPSLEPVRVQEAQQIIAKARALHARDGKQVFLAGDSNSTIYTRPKGLVHRTFIGAGFYDAFATTNITNQAYPTTNDFHFPVKPSPHRRDVILSYGGAQGSYWYKNLVYNSASQLASDHFMQVADMPVS